MRNSILTLAVLLVSVTNFAQVIDGPLDFLDSYPTLEKKIQEVYPTSKIDLHSISQKKHPSYSSIVLFIGEYKVDNDQKSQTAYYLVSKGSSQLTLLGGYRKFKDECRYDQNGDMHFSQTSSNHIVNDFMIDICKDIIGKYSSATKVELSVDDSLSRNNTKANSTSKYQNVNFGKQYIKKQ